MLEYVFTDKRLVSIKWKITDPHNTNIFIGGKRITLHIILIKHTSCEKRKTIRKLRASVFNMLILKAFTVFRFPVKILLFDDAYLHYYKTFPLLSLYFLFVEQKKSFFPLTFISYLLWKIRTFFYNLKRYVLHLTICIAQSVFIYLYTYTLNNNDDTHL